MTDLHLYRPYTDDEALLVSWYADLVASGDLYTTFYPSMHNISGFLAGFASNELLLRLCENRVWAAVWVEHTNGAPFIGIWIAAHARKSFQAAKFIIAADRATTTAYPTLLAITLQPQVVELACHLGYTTHGWIPGLWNGRPACLLSSTKESRDERWRGRLKSSDQSRDRTDTSRDESHEYQCG